MSLIGWIAKSSAQYFKDLCHTQNHSDDGEDVHCAEEDGLFEMLGHHALGKVKSLVQWTRLTEVLRMNQEPEESTLKPERCNLQDDSQEDRDDVKHGDRWTFQNVLLVYVFIRCVKMEHGSWNQHSHKLKSPKHLKTNPKRQGCHVRCKTWVRTTWMLPSSTFLY